MPDVSDALIRSWNIPPWATAGVLITALIYLHGWRSARLSRPEELPPWRAMCFLGGIAAFWLAIASPLDLLGGLLLSAHMVQHLLLMSVVPPLLLLGSPTVPLLRGLPRPFIQHTVGPLISAKPFKALARFLLHPVTGWLAMNIAYLGWHTPAAYELTLRSQGWHEVEHACFFFTSLLFWWTVLEPWPSKSVWSRWAMVPYLIAADLVNTALSAFLAFSGRVIYPTYAAAPRLFGYSALNDQIAAGAFMWVAGSSIFWIPTIAIVLRLLSSSSRRRGRYATSLVTIKAMGQNRQRFDLLRVPVIGPWLRSRYGRQSLQAVSLVVIALVIAHGFLGHQMGAMNLAGVVPWNLVRALGVLALLFVGNLFCLACPFTLPRELGHRMGLARLRWPPWLRVKWIGIALMIAFFWGYERFSLWDRPARTAWALVAYFAAAFLVDTFFRGASFCKYVCPIGQFNFISSLLSPLELKVRSQSTCSSCSTHDCIRGNTQQRGCELDLYLPQKLGNLDCTLCMDCVKACPHENVGIFARPLTRDILAAGPRSSIRHLGRRVDIASVALVLVFAAFANAAVMVAPGARLLSAAGTRLPWLTTNAGSAAGVLLLAALAAGAIVLLSRVMRPRSASAPALAVPALAVTEIFCRFSLAMLPLGLGMWAAHLLFHLTSSIPALPPLFAQAAHDLGSAAVHQPDWSMGAMAGGNFLLQLQLLFLDAGLLLTLYLGWRLARQMAAGLRRTLRMLAPWAICVVLVYAVGFWLLLQPMQMRGMMSGGAMSGGSMNGEAMTRRPMSVNSKTGGM
jgi:cytochrome c oxidase assembly factor CtaG/ferredoxin